MKNYRKLFEICAIFQSESQYKYVVIHHLRYMYSVEMKVLINKTKQKYASHLFKNRLTTPVALKGCRCPHDIDIICLQNNNMGIAVRVMVFNATFNNISAILWRSDLLLEETRVPGENYRPAASH